jgi:hypothetical protein
MCEPIQPFQVHTDKTSTQTKSSSPKTALSVGRYDIIPSAKSFLVDHQHKLMLHQVNIPAPGSLSVPTTVEHQLYGPFQSTILDPVKEALHVLGFEAEYHFSGGE